ncbi:MAG: 2-amino-4-hydroxy-6-hydroxymethyldihydropteridine diphosphokinase [Candidatus Zixiibacteriota bacterium]|nr:MAG: 2-amino-4-hydroxy-6-hydroxymethyldihydropteridine diphosphokinase [candidate division Zixibacteria bacterium]
MPETAYILLGSNVGDREKNLLTAIDGLAALPGLEIVATSGIYVSAAQEMEGENPSFMNQAVMTDYGYSPHELLAALERLEKDMGRTDKGRKKPRVIDLDILLFGDRVVKTENLEIPHPQLLKRAFAMLPLIQITPDLTHPVSGKPIASYVKESHKREVLLYKDHVARNI